MVEQPIAKFTLAILVGQFPNFFFPFCPLLSVPPPPPPLTHLNSFLSMSVTEGCGDACAGGAGTGTAVGRDDTLLLLLLLLLLGAFLWEWTLLLPTTTLLLSPERLLDSGGEKKEKAKSLIKFLFLPGYTAWQLCLCPTRPPTHPVARRAAWRP